MFINKKWFKKPINETFGEQIKKSPSSNKKGLWIAAGILAVGVLALVAKCFNAEDKTKS